MNKMVLFLALAFSSLLAFSGANAGTGKATTLMTKDLPDFPGKEGMVEIVEFAPGEVSQPHRHNADLFVYVLEGSIITQVKGGNPQTVHAGDVFFESPTDVHSVSRNASETQPAKLLVFYVKSERCSANCASRGWGEAMRLPNTDLPRYCQVCAELHCGSRP
jgi:quercetin dioxygenase-like cupin family protein